MILDVQNLSFRYNKNAKPIFHNVNFQMEKGEILTILGANGAGKSTLLNCLANILEPCSGKILVNGASIHDMSLKKAAQLIGYVPQKGILFKGTIESNIKFSDENMSDEKMITASRIAQAEEFILANIYDDMNILRCAKSEAKLLLDSNEPEKVEFCKEIKNSLERWSKYICFS